MNDPRNAKERWKAAKKAFPMSKKKMRGGRMIIEVWTKSPEEGGVLTQRSVGKTTAGLLREHANGQCHAFCGYCYEEGCRYIDSLPSLV